MRRKIHRIISGPLLRRLCQYKYSMIIGLIRFIACMAGMACALGLQAQTYPTRPIRLVVPFPPGGSSASVARVVVPKFSEGLGQPVVIENRPGVGGLLGSEAEIGRASCRERV